MTGFCWFFLVIFTCEVETKQPKRNQGAGVKTHPTSSSTDVKLAFTTPFTHNNPTKPEEPSEREKKKKKSV